MVPEDVVEGLLRGDDLGLASDLGQVGEDEVEVFGHEVAGKLVRKGIEYAQKVVVCTDEGFVMAG